MVIKSHYKKINGRLMMKGPRDVSAAMMDSSCKMPSANASNNHASTSMVRENDSLLRRPNVVQEPVGVPKKNTTCKLLSWYIKGEIVADAIIAETDPKKLVHGMPIGFGSYKLVANTSRVDDVIIYRQTNGLKRIHDAIGTYISWANDLILFD
ncbi:hypothetical protein MKW98_025133 [Papaver atlanticum]|uniref:Uncharacterized protein n=1 Tax=Papaver atlanticum TaxID=357466 RepID=A0AAD4S1H7_9MAGN|nr:hypothetical protein MKW98_025133 [Papaver atlanticum]